MHRSHYIKIIKIGHNVSYAFYHINQITLIDIPNMEWTLVHPV